MFNYGKIHRVTYYFFLNNLKIVINDFSWDFVFAKEKNQEFLMINVKMKGIYKLKKWF